MNGKMTGISIDGEKMKGKMDSRRKRADMKWNRRAIVMMGFLFGMADSVWIGSVLASFVYILANGSNTAVGLVEAAEGATILLVAIPIGYFADKGSKSKVVIFGGVVLLVAIAVSSFVVWEAAEDENEKPKWSIWVMGATMCLWGIASAVSNGPAQALLADSVEEGDRTTWYTFLFVAYIGGSILGPTVALIIFKRFGDHWTLQELRNVFLAGMALEGVASVTMFVLRDIPKKPKESSKEKEANEASEISKTCCYGLITKKAIPVVLFLSSVVSALGSGMTVKFFPLYFQNNLKLDPSGVQVVYILVPVAMSILSGLSTFLAAHIGRVFCMVWFNLMGIGCLVAMSLLSDKLPQLPLCAIYIIRTGLMNATYPLNESILMDTVPETQRARWKSLESVAQFGWCGSAVIGGLVSDKHGYERTFIITAGIQALATLILIPLIFIVPMEEKKRKVSREYSDDETTALIGNEENAINS
eukprot:m.336036 g.336036  ORF g.336036 m.336036 type:complete len:474 (-) comp17739_c0_seq1:3189-4610(-)